jgi:hypothetical protein
VSKVSVACSNPQSPAHDRLIDEYIRAFQRPEVMRNVPRTAQSTREEVSTELRCQWTEGGGQIHTEKGWEEPQYQLYRETLILHRAKNI